MKQTSDRRSTCSVSASSESVFEVQLLPPNGYQSVSPPVPGLLFSLTPDPKPIIRSFAPQIAELVLQIADEFGGLDSLTLPTTEVHLYVPSPHLPPDHLPPLPEHHPYTKQDFWFRWFCEGWNHHAFANVTWRWHFAVLGNPCPTPEDLENAWKADRAPAVRPGAYLR